MSSGTYQIGRGVRRLALLSVVLNVAIVPAAPAQEVINAFNAKALQTLTEMERELNELAGQLHRELDGQEFDAGSGVKKIDAKTIDQWLKRPTEEIQAALK